MLALEQVSVTDVLKEMQKQRKSSQETVIQNTTEKKKNNRVLVPSPRYTQQSDTNLSSTGTRSPHPGGGWNDDVDPPNFNQLKLGLWQPLPQFYNEFCSAQAPSSTHIPFCQGFLHFGVGETLLCERSLAFFILAASNNKSLLPISGLVAYFSKPSFCITYSLLHS